MLSTFVLVAVATQAAGAKPIRHLDYHFGISVQTTDTHHVSGIGSGPISGVLNSNTSGSTEGSISVDVVGLRADGGLVVNVLETSRQIPHPDSVQCITWGVGTVVCEPGKHASPEEQALLRYLGRYFVNPAMIDQNNDWKIGTSAKDESETSDYHIASNEGGVMAISFQRVSTMPGVQGFTATTDGKLTYDSNLSVPRAISEDTLLRTSLVNGNVEQGGYEQVRTMLNLQLLDDSMASKTP